MTETKELELNRKMGQFKNTLEIITGTLTGIKDKEIKHTSGSVFSETRTIKYCYLIIKDKNEERRAFFPSSFGYEEGFKIMNKRIKYETHTTGYNECALGDLVGTTYTISVFNDEDLEIFKSEDRLVN